MPGQWKVYTHGSMVALLEGHVGTQNIADAEPIFLGKVYDFDQFYWTHTGTILRLQGVPVFEVLGMALVLLRGNHRPVYDPRPGASDVRVVMPLENPANLSQRQIFELAIRLEF